MNTDREIEIQKMVLEVIHDMERLATSQLPNLKDSMELCYYLKQLTNRLEVIASLRFKV